MDNLSTIILASALIIIMLGMGLGLVKDDFKRILLSPKAILIGLANQLILLPLIGYFLVSTFPLQPEIAIGIMLLAACPGGPTSNLISHLAKGDTALSVSLTALSSIITILTIPFIVNFALEEFLDAGQMIQLNPIKVVGQVLAITVIPITIGMIIRNKNAAFADKMSKPVKIGSGIVLALVIVGIILKEKDNFVSYFQQAGLVALCLNLATMIVGYLTAKIFQLRKDQAISISIESGIQNGTLAIFIAVTLLNNTTYAIAPAVYSLIMFLTGGLVVYLGTKKKA
jgi:BASS family bile acid:Na+ symporter